MKAEQVTVMMENNHKEGSDGLFGRTIKKFKEEVQKSKKGDGSKKRCYVKYCQLKQKL